ncbi:hypothetical protein GALL_291880 [mine drainage metagenome]|uniref:Uncharacterized protein n=1 Tax=mine drainage metagenome TaxID=410659 RepID=A0A1J5QYX8_9ZZZZ
MGGVVVHDQVQFAVGAGAGDLALERRELSAAVAGLQGAGDMAGGDLQCGEQRGGAVADVVGRAALDQVRLGRQHRGGAAGGLDLGLFVHAQHDRVLGWGEAEPDDIGDRGDQLGSVENRNDSERHDCTPNSRDRGIADLKVVGQQPRGPVRHAVPLLRRLQYL